MNPLLDPSAKLVIAHRGDRANVAENTLDALVAAVELGADAVEFDVRMTRDGVPVLLHDAALDRTTSGHGLLAHYSLADVRTLDAGRRVKPGSARVQIPLLEEVLDRLPNTPLVIEVTERGAADATAALVRKFGAMERVLVGSGIASVVERFKTLAFATCASTVDALRLIPTAIIGGVAPRLRYAALSLTPRYSGLPIPVLQMTAAAKRAGIPTQVWTVNDPYEAQRYWAGGVAAILTDDPGLMLRAKRG
jgi:glycerophosphoryl diester phosphodiesterase